MAEGPSIPANDDDGASADDGIPAADDGQPADEGEPTTDDGEDDIAIVDDEGGAPAPSDDGGKSNPSTKPKTVWTEERCAEERDQAMKDRLAGKFASVLTHTRIKKCWPNARERLELRVRALSELGRYQECIDTGGSSTDAGIARMVRRCRKHLEG